MIDLFLQRPRPASSAPVRPHWPSHEVHRHDEAKRQDSALRITLKFLQDVQAGQGEKSHASQPEEATENGVEKVEESTQEHREEPVCYQHGGHE